jgi:alpha-beta hydrolase superfamily lysophospholipase
MGPIGLYVQIARELANAGIACARFDARGFGESYGEYKSASYETLASDLRNALAMISEVPGVDRGRIGLLGHSLGGNIAVEVASSSPLVRVLCLLSPNPTHNESDISMFSHVQLDELKTFGYTLRKGIYASQRVYEPINAGMTLKQAALVQTATLMVYGAQDQYYTGDQYSRLARAFRTSVSINEIPEADHNFLPLETRIQLISTILMWVKKEFGKSREV